MKNILCLTDFSNASENAKNYAAWFAARTGARITLLHVVRERAFFAGILGENTEAERNRRLEEATKKLFASCEALLSRPAAAASGLTCDFRTGEGSLADVVNYYCSHEQYDMIIMGTTGVSGDTLGELMLGSNALALFGKLKVPVLAVPRSYHKRQMQQVVFATDYQPADEQVVQETIRIASPFNAHLHVLHICKTESAEARQKLVQFVRPLADSYEHLHFNIIASHDTEAGVLALADQLSADLVVLVGKEYSFFERMFSQSTTEMVTYQCRMPLLVFPAAWKKMLRQQDANTAGQQAIP